MPGKLKVKIVAGRHLPVMDRASDLTDAFVEVGGRRGGGAGEARRARAAEAPAGPVRRLGAAGEQRQGEGRAPWAAPEGIWVRYQRELLHGSGGQTWERAARGGGGVAVLEVFKTGRGAQCPGVVVMVVVGHSLGSVISFLA